MVTVVVGKEPMVLIYSWHSCLTGGRFHHGGCSWNETDGADMILASLA
jgi:hypothetical protein